MRPLSASGTSAKASTSTSPRSVIFSDGITDSARNESVMNGASISTPCSASRSCRPSSPSATSSSGRSESSPAIGSASSPTHRAPARDDEPAAQLLRPRGAQRHVGVVDADDDEVVRVVGDGRGERARGAARSRARARGPTRPVPWWRSITAIFARSRAGSATTCPSATVGASASASVISWPGLDADHPHALGRARRCRTRPAPSASCRAARPAAPSGYDRLAPVLEHQRGAEVDEVVEQREVGDVAGRDRAAVEQPVRPRAVQRGHHEHVLGRHALGHRDPAHLVDVALAVEEVRLAVVGAERAVVRPVLAHHRQQRAQVAGVGGLADQHPHPAPALLQRLRGGERLVVGGDARRRRRRPARAPITPGACPSTCGATIRASTSGSPAMTPGKFIISATPSARGCSQDLRASRPGPSGPHGRLEVRRRNARRRHHEDVQRQPVGGAEQPVDALDAGDVGDLVRVADDRGRPARHDGPRELAGRELGRLEVHVRVDEAGDEELPAPVDPLAAVVGADARRSARRRSRRRRRATRA